MLRTKRHPRLHAAWLALTAMTHLLAACDATPPEGARAGDATHGSADTGGGGDDAAPDASTSSGDGGAAGGDAATPDAPTPWVFDGDDGDVEPLLDPGARAELVREALDVALGNAVAPVVEAHDRLLAAAARTDDGCPAMSADTSEDGTMETTIWYGPCEDDAGLYFYGAVAITRYDGYFDEATGRDRTGVELQSVDAFILGVGGEKFTGAFYAGIYDEDLDTSRLSFNVFLGTVDAATEDDEGELEVVAPPAEAATITHHDVEALDTLLVYADGSVILDQRAVTFSDFTIGDAFAVACPEEPGGAVAIRDVDGNTYDVIFDGVDEEGRSTAACDACGPTSFRGSDLEPSCVETDSLLDLENAPW